MSVKNFLIVSLIIHLTGFIVFYFYSNPIVFEPQPVATPLEPKKPKLKKLTDSKFNKTSKKRDQTTQILKNKEIHKNIKKSKKTKLLQKKPNPKIKKQISQKNSIIKKNLSKTINTRTQTPLNYKKTKDFQADSKLKPIKKNRFSKPETHSNIKKKEKTTINLKELPKKTKKLREKNTNKAVSFQKKSVENPSLSFLEKRKNNNFTNFQKLKQKKNNIPLIYPDFARREKMEGTVSVLFFVSKKGLVDQIQLLSSSGYPRLDNYVLRSLAKYEFVTEQEAWVKHSIPFQLKGEEKEFQRLRTLEE